eukprot:CAMPEP_0114509170 /NCGR_PEP_ID=MMETSP0109-20121206/13051_1 /TAXON_ID=29199 /ORGANISM="Chlorarachnion reptans, Strain CCCM449" /LENGTH=388 /DNA_ID=CAMNT_0001688273 /DNA_START=149 /DNA_END=1315 /DNA_ORIENTATION=-
MSLEDHGGGQTEQQGGLVRVYEVPESEESGLDPQSDGWKKLLRLQLPILGNDTVSKKVFEMNIFSRKIGPTNIGLHPELLRQYKKDRGKDRSVAIVMAGDVRTFLCPENRQNLIATTIAPLRMAGYNPVHVFAWVRPSIYFGTSNWIRYCPKSSFANLNKSTVPKEVVHKAFHEFESSCNVTMKVEIKDLFEHDPILVAPDAQTKALGCNSLQKENRISEGNAFVFFNRYRQWDAVSSGYELMLDFERRTNHRFSHVLRLRPDLHAFMNTILHKGTKALEIDQQRKKHFIIHQGDNSAMMRRHLSDVYFSTFRTYKRICDVIASQSKWGHFDFGLMHDRFAILHAVQYGIKMASSPELFFRASRPRNCSSLCDKRAPLSLKSSAELQK